MKLKYFLKKEEEGLWTELIRLSRTTIRGLLSPQ